MSEEIWDSILIRALGGSPKLRILDRLLDYKQNDFTKKEIVEALGMSRLTFYECFGGLEELCLVTATADTVLLPVNYVLRAHLEPKNDYEPIPSLARKRSPCSRNPVLLREMTSLNA